MRLTEDRFPSTSSAPAEGSAGADAAHAHLPAELERRHSEAALRDSEARFRQLFEKIPNISVQGYDAQRRVIFWNPASTELYGYSNEEVLGRALDDVLIPPELGIDIESLHRDWIEHGIEIPAGEILLRHKDGHRVPVFSSHVLLRNGWGSPEMYCIDVDLSPLEEIQFQYRLLADSGSALIWTTDQAMHVAVSVDHVLRDQDEVHPHMAVGVESLNIDRNP